MRSEIGGENKGNEQRVIGLGGPIKQHPGKSTALV
jgi:hypothetical protein